MPVIPIGTCSFGTIRCCPVPVYGIMLIVNCAQNVRLCDTVPYTVVQAVALEVEWLAEIVHNVVHGWYAQTWG